MSVFLPLSDEPVCQGSKAAALDNYLLRSARCESVIRDRGIFIVVAIVRPSKKDSTA